MFILLNALVHTDIKLLRETITPIFTYDFALEPPEITNLFVRNIKSSKIYLTISK